MRGGFIKIWKYMKFLSICLLVLCSLLSTPVSAGCWWESCLECDCPEKTYVNQFFLGPEIYQVNRKREGGAAQDGVIYGVRGGYEHIKRYKFYWAVDALYGEGHLTGKSKAGNKLKSNFVDKNIEGRFGYTFQQKAGFRFSFTPFVGVGYATECNNFVKPSPLPVHFELRYNYACAGFLSQMSFNRCFDGGINFKLKYVGEIKNHVTHDPDFDDNKMLVKEEFQYRVEVPLTYEYCPRFLIRLEPFYEFRHFGSHINYPFDYFDTKLNIYGATLKFIYCFDKWW